MQGESSMRNPKVRYSSSLLAAAGLALALAACSSVLGLGGPRISLSLAMEQVLPEAPVLRVDIGGEGVEVVATSASAPRDERQVRGPRYGDVPVRVALLGPSGDTMAAVEFTQGFQRDHNHWVSGIVGQRRPLGHCIGALAVAPLCNAESDSLYVMYGGMPEGAIC
jgi:hypothetical protein